MLVAAVYLATGLVWTGRSLLEVMAHPDYWEPVTFTDWVAVWSYSLAFALTALAVLLLARDARAGRLVGVIAVIVGAAAALAAVANVIEDAFDVSGTSMFYVIGALGTLIGLLALATGLAIRGRASPAGVAALIAIGMAMQMFGLGWLVLIGGFIAARDHLAAQRRRQPGEALT